MMTYRSASLFSLEELVGKKVVSLRDFNAVPSGTVGTVTEAYGNLGQHRGVMVLWTTTEGRDVSDGFGRDESFDETGFLAVIE